MTSVLSLTRNLWAILKRRSPRAARLVKVCVITCVGGSERARSVVRALEPMTLAMSHVSHRVGARVSGPRFSAYSAGVRSTALAPRRGAKCRGPAEIAEGRVKWSIVHRFGDVLAIAYLDRHYRRICQSLIGEQCDERCRAEHPAGTSIMLIGGSLGPGGAERQIIMTLVGLASRGYRDLSLVCAQLGGEINNFYAHLLDGCPVSISELSRDQASPVGDRGDGGAPICMGLKGLAGRLPAELNEIHRYATEILARRPGLVHTWLDEVNVKAGLAAAIVGVPRIVLSTRSVAPDNFVFFRPYMREAYRALVAHPNVLLLNNSEAGARDYEEWLALPRGTVKVVRNGFDFSALDRSGNIARGREFRNRCGIPASAPVVGSVLRFSEEKQPLLWLDVAQRVSERRSDVMFLMVGDGPLRDEARRRAEAKGIDGRILMPGYETDVAPAIAAMDVFLLTSRAEGLPNVLIEAQALGVPVVTTDAGGAVETLDAGNTGFAVFPHCAELLAQAVLRILSDAVWRAAARETAQRFVRERFSRSRMVDRTLDAYAARGEFTQKRIGWCGMKGRTRAVRQLGND